MAANDDARDALAEALRRQIEGRVAGQLHTVVVAAALAGAVGAFAAGRLASQPELMALLALLYVGFALAVLRGDQEITIIAKHLLSKEAFAEHAEAQAQWEVHKVNTMQRSGLIALLASGSQSIGIYAVPVLGAAAFTWATLDASPNWVAWFILSVSFVLWAFFFIGVRDVFVRYRELGDGVRE